MPMFGIQSTLRYEIVGEYASLFLSLLILIFILMYLLMNILMTLYGAANYIRIILKLSASTCFVAVLVAGP